MIGQDHVLGVVSRRQVGLLTMPGAELVLTCVAQSCHLPAETARTSRSFTIFEGTSEIQRMIIGRAVTGLDVR
jgi:alkylation response protein AidB-like acyl-CoA dehydrogenase